MPSNTVSNKYRGSGNLSYLWVKESYEKAVDLEKFRNTFSQNFETGEWFKSSQWVLKVSASGKSERNRIGWQQILSSIYNLGSMFPGPPHSGV
jgi:hypothetical protein